MLLALHRTAVLRHDAIGQETLLNLLLRNYLHNNLYDQVRRCYQCSTMLQHTRKHTPQRLQAEKLRSKAQRPETTRSNQQACRYLYYLGRIRAIQLEYTEAKDCLQQAARKVRPCESHSTVCVLVVMLRCVSAAHCAVSAAPLHPHSPPQQAPTVATAFLVTVNKWLILVRLLLGEIPERADFTAPGMRAPLLPYFELTQVVRSGDLLQFKCVLGEDV